jgi:hypothetical protein
MEEIVPHALVHHPISCPLEVDAGGLFLVKVVVPSPQTLSWDACSMTHLETHSPTVNFVLFCMYCKIGCTLNNN